jgi:uncharacterized protein
LAASAQPRAVLVIARAPRAGTAGNELEPMLGPERAVALGRTLIERATRWAGKIAPGAVHVAYEPSDAGPELRSLLGPGVGLLAQGAGGAGPWLPAVTARLFAGGAGDGPVLIIWPDLPSWRPDHADGALDDLGHGCDFSIGPGFDGGFYLIALARPLPPLYALTEPAWRGPDAIGMAIAAANEAGLEVGLLRAERGLHRAQDVRAMLADPLLDSELRELLGSGAAPSADRGPRT